MGKDKEKKSRKRKREKDKDGHHKKKKRKSSATEYQWVEAPSTVTPSPSMIEEEKKVEVSNTPQSIPSSTPVKKRDDWMVTPTRRERTKKIEEEKEAPSYKPVELNPFVSNPSKLKEISKSDKPMYVGDGGKSWRDKAKQRALERKAEERKNPSSSSRKEENVSSHYGKESSHSNRNDSNFQYTSEELRLAPNRLKAMAMKEKMKGNKNEYDRLMNLYEKGPESIVMLSGLDERGNRIKDKPQPSKEPVKMISSDGTREAFFNDDNRSLKDLVEEEKLGNYSNETMAKNIMKNPNYKEPNLKNDEEYDTSILETSSSKHSKLSEEQYKELMKQKQVKADTAFQRVTDNCQYCLGSKNAFKGSLISLGEYSYLSLPQYGQLVPGHCLIVPMNHCISLRTVEENVYEEIEKFKKYLQRMFFDNDLEAVFIETAIRFKKQYHTYIECIPLPKDIAEDAPFYFQKELNDSGSKWSANPKIVKCREKGLRRSIPENFEYFYVEFATGDSFAHVIEDKFPSDFGREIICGILDLPYGKNIRKRVMNLEQATSLLRSFLPMWKAYDFTQYLEGGEYIEE